MTTEVSPPTPDPAVPSPAAEATGTRWLDPEEQRTWRAWLYSSLLLQDRLDRELTRETGIPHAYYEILVQLSEAPERRMRMSQLADECLSSRSRLSHAVSRL
ncbi:MAG: Transcriptional regulator, MarR family, partial [Modestobacter sp.]|nr:Transcriptional regulator, MarR family [Modestobacter sp.]